MTGRPRLVDTVLADAQRAGIAEERAHLATLPRNYRRSVLERMRRWETDIDALTARIERLRGRMVADNQWLNQHPDRSV